MTKLNLDAKISATEFYNIVLLSKSEEIKTHSFDVDNYEALRLFKIADVFALFHVDESGDDTVFVTRNEYEAINEFDVELNETNELIKGIKAQ